MPQPRNDLRFSYILILLLFFCFNTIAQTTILSDVINAAGNENFSVTSARYSLTSSIGQPTPISKNPLVGTTYSLYPGYRKIDRDYWYPFSWFNIAVHYASDTSFVLTWTGMDSTSHDGEGWGIWNYDIQYKVGSGGSWTDWMMATTLSTADFGPSVPVDVVEGQAYYFRLRARDRVRNVSPWTEQDSMIVNYAVQFCIHTPSPGLLTDEYNFATIEYYPSEGVPIEVEIWEGECVEIWCVPGEEVDISRITSDSDAEERWAVPDLDDTAFVITGVPDEYEIEFWHQLKPIIHLFGTDISHTVSTIQHEHFGSPHLESDQYDTWSQWADYSSTIEFSEWTTGSPARRAEVDDSVRFHDIESFFIDSINYSASGYLVAIETNFGDSVYVDGTRYESPYYTNWFDGSTHQIAVNRQVDISECEKYIFQRWSDGSTDTFRTITVYSDSTFTAIFEHQFRVQISNPTGIGDPIPDVGYYWYVEGDTAIGLIDTYGIFSHMLVGYLGTGSALSGGGDEFWFEVYDCSSIEWVWVPTSDDLCTLRVYSRYGHPHPIGIYVVPRGTSVWCSVEDSTFEEGEWHYCTGFLGDGSVAPISGSENVVNFVMDDNGWLVWQWDGTLELSLVISSSPSVHGPPVPFIGTHWYPVDSDIEAYVANNPDSGWWCTGYTAFGAIPSTSADSVHFTLNAPTEIDWHWIYYPSGPVDTVWIFSRFGEPLPTRGRHMYPHGTDIIAYVTPTDGSHWCSGWSGTGSTPLSGAGTTVGFTLNMFSTLTWNWDGEDLIPFVVINPGGHDSPNPPEGVHWYEPLSCFTAYVTSPAFGWYCVGYNGFGSVPMFGYSGYCDITLTMASGIEWLWSNDVVTLRVSAPSYSSPIPPIGTTYHPVGRHIVASNIDTLWIHPAFRHSCRGWTGDGIVVPDSGIGNLVEFDMTHSGSISWIYDDQYYIELAHTGLPDSVNPINLGVEGWYNSGDSAVLVTDSVVMDEEDPYVFVQWHDSGYGALIDDINSDSTFILIDSSYNLVAEFREAVWVEIIKSPIGDSLGWIRVDDDTTYGESYAGYLVRGFEYTIQVSILDFNYEVMFDFLRWRVDSSISETRVFIPESDTTLYVDYNKRWHVIIEKHPQENHIGRLVVDTDTYTGVDVVRQEFWWDEGSTHRVEHTLSDSTAFLKYEFFRWNDGVTTPTRLCGPIVGFDSLAAIYTKKSLCRVEKVPRETHGAIKVDGELYPGVAIVDFWHEWGTSLLLEVSNYDVFSDSVYIFDYWGIPGFPTDTSLTVPEVTIPDTFFAHYIPTRIQINLEIAQRGIFPNDSVYWVIPGTLDWAEEKAMLNTDSIKIYSYSNVPIELGLEVQNILDITAGWVEDPDWRPAYNPGSNKFSLYAQFTDLSTPPVSWTRIHDYIKDSPVWATSVIFGPGGYFLPPEGEPGSTTMLWFDFVAPISCENPNHQRCIEVLLLAQIYLP
ncbi:fibronectin type III domain-containing protein [bacterium]|nr:fibronectin type III domain-containing protein [bacterium]